MPKSSLALMQKKMAYSKVRGKLQLLINWDLRVIIISLMVGIYQKIKGMLQLFLRPNQVKKMFIQKNG